MNNQKNRQELVAFWKLDENVPEKNHVVRALNRKETTVCIIKQQEFTDGTRKFTVVITVPPAEKT